MARTNVTSRAIIINNDKILLMHRRKNGEEYFVLPGGGVEEGETPEEAVKREVYEETGLNSKDIKTAFDVIDADNKLIHLFYIEVGSGTPELTGEEKDKNCENDWYNPEWFSLSILKKPNVYPAQAIDLLRKYLDK